jgi:PII-like signaling protein
MTTLDGPARRLTVYVGEADTWHHRPVHSEIVHRAHVAGLAGASVFRGIEGFGSSHLVHTSRLLSLSEDLPVVVVVVDTAERIDAFLPLVQEVVGEGLVTIDDVTVVHHTYRPRPDAADPDTSDASEAPHDEGSGR